MHDPKRAPDAGAYTTGQWVAAVGLSAVFGWAALILPRLVFPQIQSWDNMLGILLPMALFGLPAALVLALVFVAWPLRVMMRRPIGYRRAGFSAEGISAGLAGLSILIGRLNGLRMSRDPHVHSQIGGGEFVRSVDGILTPYGWWVLGVNSLSFVAACALSGLAIRAIIGPGQSRPTD